MANTGDLIREANRNGEEYLRTQMQIALAADQRAISLGGILVAAASVVLGFLLTDDGTMPEGASAICLLMSLGLGVASGLSFYAARPVKIWVVGNSPSHWDDDIERDKPIDDALREHNKHIDEQIDDNTAIIDRNASFLYWAMRIAAVVVIVSAIWGIGLALSEITPPAASSPSTRG